MRLVTYILLALSCLFALNVLAASSLPSYRAFLQEVKSDVFPAYTPEIKKVSPEEARTEKLIQSIDRLGEKFDSLEKPQTDVSVTTSGAMLSGATATGKTVS